MVKLKKDKINKKKRVKNKKEQTVHVIDSNETLDSTKQLRPHVRDEVSENTPKINLSKDMYKIYLKQLENEFDTKSASEFSYRVPLVNLLEKMAPSLGVQNESISKNDIKLFYKKTNLPFATIETKKISNLTIAKLIKKNSAQLKKYLKTQHYILVTDFLKFAVLSLTSNNKISIINQLEIKSHGDFVSKKYTTSQHKELELIFKVFFECKTKTKVILTQKELAQNLAKNAQSLSKSTLKHIKKIEAVLKIIETAPKKEIDNVLIDPIYIFYKQYTYLNQSNDIKEISDAFGQTVACGIFLAKFNSKIDGDLELEGSNNVSNNVSDIVPVIRELFYNIEIRNRYLPDDVSNEIERMVKIINQTNMDKIKNESKDVFLYFYEEFLKTFDHKTREQRGVYYTPLEVVDWICNKVNSALKEDFAKSSGFGDANVKTLDPATGTGTFLTRAIEIAISETHQNHSPNTIARHLINNFIGFEILVPAYIIAHMKIRSQLHEIGYGGNKRAQIYLTNTLAATSKNTLPYGELAEEINSANKTKDSDTIMVVIGNPPWSAINKIKLDTSFIDKQMEDYKKNHKKGTHSLDDPYVLFVRFAQHKIEQHGSGIVGMIVNNSFLDGMGFQDMRRSLYNTFDKIYLFNLHGLVKLDPKDENIFDITVPNTIVIMIKNNKNNQLDESSQSECKVWYSEHKGSRASKIKQLQKALKYVELNPQENKQFLFIPYTQNEEYEQANSLSEIFEVMFTGSNTHNDDFCVSTSPHTFREPIEMIVSSGVKNFKEQASDDKLLDELAERFGAKRKKFAPKLKKIRAEGFKEDLVDRYAYRPFDNRYAYFSTNVMGAPRKIKSCVDASTLSICAPPKSVMPWSAVFMAKGMPDIKFAEHITPSHVFPLMLKNAMPKSQELDLGNNVSIPKDSAGSAYNFTTKFISYIFAKYGNKISEKEIFFYIYGILHSLKYRIKFGYALIQDFPRIIFPDDEKILYNIAKYGKQLCEYHTMSKTFKPKIAWRDINEFSNIKVQTNKDKSITVNIGWHSISKIPEHVWNFKISKRQILGELLKKRFFPQIIDNESKIPIDEQQLFLNVCGAIIKTLDIQSLIDKSLEKDVTFKTIFRDVKNEA